MSDAATIGRVTDAVRTLRRLLAVVVIPDALLDELRALATRVDVMLTHERAEGVPTVSVIELIREIEALGVRVRAYVAA